MMLRMCQSVRPNPVSPSEVSIHLSECVPGHFCNNVENFKSSRELCICEVSLSSGLCSFIILSWITVTFDLWKKVT